MSSKKGILKWHRCERINVAVKWKTLMNFWNSKLPEIWKFLQHGILFSRMSRNLEFQKSRISKGLEIEIFGNTKIWNSMFLECPNFCISGKSWILEIEKSQISHIFYIWKPFFVLSHLWSLIYSFLGRHIWFFFLIFANFTYICHSFEVGWVIPSLYLLASVDTKEAAVLVIRYSSHYGWAH